MEQAVTGKKISPDSAPSRKFLFGALVVFFLFTWINFIFSSLIGDLKLFMASARQASFISDDLIVGSFRAWELKSVLSRELSYFLYKIAILFFPFGTYAFECVCKGVYSILLLLTVFFSMKLLFGKDRNKVFRSFLSVSALFMACAIDDHMQVEMTVMLLILLAFSLYWNAIVTKELYVWKLLGAGVLIGASFYFKSLLLLMSVSVVAAVCIFLIEGGRKLSFGRMMIVVAGSLLSLAVLSLIVYLVNPLEFREILNAADYQGAVLDRFLTKTQFVLAFLAHHLEKPAFTPVIAVGFVCLFLNLVRVIREEKGKRFRLIFFHFVLWFVPTVFLSVSGYFFTYHFFPYMFPTVIEIGDLLNHRNKTREIILGTASFLAAAWFVIFFSVLSYNNRTYIRLQHEAYEKTEAFLESIDFDRREPVLYLDDGMGAYTLGNPSHLRFFFPLPLQRLHDRSTNLSHVEALEGAMSFDGKYVSVYDPWIFEGGRYSAIRKKLNEEYTLVGQYSLFNAPYAIFPKYDTAIRTLDLYVRNE